MKIGLVIPWRPQPSRLSAFAATTDRYAEMLPDVTMYLADSPGEIFSMSASRNKGCLEAISDGVDVLIVSDADVFLDPYPLSKSIEKAFKKNVVSVPYTELLVLDQGQSEQIAAGEYGLVEMRIRSRMLHRQVGGIFVLSSSTFGILNGWDERFVGWGFEDLAMQEAHKAIFGEDFDRPHGIAACLYHEDRDKSELAANESRFEEYRGLKLSKAEMLEHVKGNRV